MSSHEVIALVTDVLRGQLASALPPGTQVIVQAPSPDAPAREGLFVHLLRIALAKARRNEVMERRVGASTLLPPLELELDYLVAGLGGEALVELALLDATLQSVSERPMRLHETLGEGLSQPARWASLASGSLTVRWLLLDVPLEQMAGLWAASGIRQRAGLLVRAEVQWRAEPPSPAPVIGV
ncbi:hypothetical protein ASD77_13395 [Pseudoxanthomonas sp. Root65]|uniref:Pvc16 family protein n=1 Tax=Pseudoxanthomonas sp. Root65 TaxID=1736576 RepID=UPI0006F6DB9D|nr:Pvc16 family protein [Pseudoxanthomonas sp. Root65]KRA52627.1 hypothetical protein ASD77_13395 [Pseudoxanthomonas sp. Root65]